MNRRKLNIRTWCSLGLAVVLVIFCLVLSTGVTWARYRTDVSADLLFETRSPVSVYLGKLEYCEPGEGTEKAEKKFVETKEGTWVWNENGQLQLDFAVANGISDKKYEKVDQQVRVRVASSLGLQSEGQTLVLKLAVPKSEEPQEESSETTTEPTTKPTTAPTTEPVTEPTTTPTADPTSEPTSEPTVEPVAEPTTEPTQTQPQTMNQTQTATEEIQEYDIFEAKAVNIADGSFMHTAFGEGWVYCFVNEEGEELGWILEGGAWNFLEMHLILEGGTPADTSLLQLQIESSYTPK